MFWLLWEPYFPYFLAAPKSMEEVPFVRWNLQKYPEFSLRSQIFFSDFVLIYCVPNTVFKLFFQGKVWIKLEWHWNVCHYFFDEELFYCGFIFCIVNPTSNWRRSKLCQNYEWPYPYFGKQVSASWMFSISLNRIFLLLI